MDEKKTSTMCEYAVDVIMDKNDDYETMQKNITDRFADYLLQHWDEFVNVEKITDGYRCSVKLGFV